MDTFQFLMFLMFLSYYLFCYSYSYTLIFDKEYTVKRKILLLVVWIICGIIITPLHLADALVNKLK